MLFLQVGFLVYIFVKTSSKKKKIVLVEQEIRPQPELENLLNYNVQGGSEVDEVPNFLELAKQIDFKAI